MLKDCDCVSSKQMSCIKNQNKNDLKKTENITRNNFHITWHSFYSSKMTLEAKTYHKKLWSYMNLRLELHENWVKVIVLTKNVTLINNNNYVYSDNIKPLTLHKKWSFPFRISFVNVTKSSVSCGFGHIYWVDP